MQNVTVPCSLLPSAASTPSVIGYRSIDPEHHMMPQHVHSPLMYCQIVQDTIFLTSSAFYTVSAFGDRAPLKIIIIRPEYSWPIASVLIGTKHQARVE